MSIELNIYDEKMKKTLEVLKKDLSGLRTGRASINLLDSILVEAYGSKVPINQVSNISVPEARLITVQVWDDGLFSIAEKTISLSHFKLSAAN